MPQPARICKVYNCPKVSRTRTNVTVHTDAACPSIRHIPSDCPAKRSAGTNADADIDPRYQTSQCLSVKTIKASTPT